METMIILGSKTEDTKSSFLKAFSIFGVCITEESLDCEFTTLDPDTSSVVNSVKGDATAVCRGDDDFLVIGCGAWTGSGLEFTVEEFVETVIGLALALC
jgi:hypothetical protein